MKKIPTLFKRDDHGKITPEYCDPIVRTIVEGGYALATEKVDGMNVRVTVRNEQIVRLEKRRNPSPAQKKQGIIEPWYVDAHRDDSADTYLFDAADNSSFEFDGEHCAEAVGPMIQGNPLGLIKRQLIFFENDYRLILANPVPPGNYKGLQNYLTAASSGIGGPACDIEGIVWWYKGEPIAKIKAKDFNEAQ